MLIPYLYSDGNFLPHNTKAWVPDAVAAMAFLLTGG